MPHTFSPYSKLYHLEIKERSWTRYSELWPEKVPNDLFNYHLQFLVKKSSRTHLRLVRQPALL